ncbi:Hypothetical predicted protein [Lecanosticta acicola]|uniref:Sexual development protein n=1 Tax=Lecanosticta acicola TaxID=111012 RepID=A0AAI8YXS7_9PEZI|nr:Hypothetical predicted protein [Lecanosticta acicola]
MLSTLAVSAVLGLTVSAAPSNLDSMRMSGNPGSYGPGHWNGKTGPDNGQQPFKFPLANGFPNITNPSDALNQIQIQAHGTLPNATLPSSISDLTATTFQLIAFNELFEVAFFTSLLQNITDNVSGFDIGSGAAKQIVVNAITAVQAQEELHALGAEGILQAAGRDQILPCEYVFPTNDFDGAIALASTFTDVVLGTLQDAQLNFGKDGDIGFLPLVGSVIGQEGEQNGFYRLLGNKIPSALPFLTRSAGAFAFSALNQMFIVPGSCPNLHVLSSALPIFGTLNVDTKTPQLEDQLLSFSIPNTNGTQIDADTNAIAYINQQNVPVTQKIQNVKSEYGKVTFQAFFPGQTNLMNGLTIAAVTKGMGPFAAIEDVVAATLFGPGFIEIN